MGKQPTWPQLCLEAGLADKLVVEGSEEGGSGGLEGGCRQRKNLRFTLCSTRLQLSKLIAVL